MGKHEIEQVEFEKMLDEIGESNLVVSTGEKFAEIPITLNQLVDYIHSSGNCPSRRRSHKDESGSDSVH